MIGLTVWFTGFSGSGKSTICRAVHEKLIARGMSVEILDGDDLRKTLTRDLGFTKADRDENIHRIGFVAHLLAKHGVVVLVAAISPYRAIREQVRQTVGNFIEVYVSAPLDICESRDPKGLYAKARSGELRSFTGIDDPYEVPLKPDVECRTVEESLEESRDKVIKAILEFYSRSDILIRYNTKRTGEDDLWRVIVDGVELLVSGFVIEGRVTDKISLNEQGETKYNVGCCGRVRIIDNIARIEAL